MIDRSSAAYSQKSNKILLKTINFKILFSTYCHLVKHEHTFNHLPENKQEKEKNVRGLKRMIVN